MRFPNANKYVAGFVRERVKGKSYRLILQYKDESGQWVKKPSKTVKCGGKREAQDLLIEFQQEMEELANIAPQAPTAKELTVEIATTQYLDMQLNVFHTIEKSTYSIQINMANKRIYPYVGNIPLRKFNVQDIQNLWSELSHEGLKQSSIRTIFNVLKKVFEYHYKIETIPINPFKKLIAYPATGNPKVCHLSPEMMEKLEDDLFTYPFKDSRTFCAIYLAAYGGLRRGEICGLKWQDVDFEAGTISINNAIGRAKGGAYTKEPKNKSSKRTFPMLPQLYEKLQEELIVQCSRDYNIKGIKNMPGEFYVCGNRTEFMKPNTLDDHVRQFFEDCDIRDTDGHLITLHGLRHNFATLGVLSHVDIKSLQGMLGHASAGMTLDTYADVDNTAMKISAGKMGDYVERKANVNAAEPFESKQHIEEALRVANVGEVTAEQLLRCIELIQQGKLEV